MGTPRDYYLTIFVDPDKDYLPVRQTWRRSDGPILLEVTTDDWDQLPGGHWLPRRLTKSFRGSEGREITFEVVRAAVNQEIAAEQLDLVAPNGTYVDDQIAGLRYVVGEEAEGRPVGQSGLESGAFLSPEPRIVQPGDIVNKTRTQEDLARVWSTSDDLSRLAPPRRRGWVRNLGLAGGVFCAALGGAVVAGRTWRRCRSRQAKAPA